MLFLGIRNSFPFINVTMGFLNMYSTPNILLDCIQNMKNRFGTDLWDYL